MRTYLHIDLARRSSRAVELSGEDLAKAGRYLIAKTLLEGGVATVDPLSADNPLIFSAGPFAGTNFSNGNRLSVGCKSPLTGGIKESNAGGTMAFALGHLAIAGFTLSGQADEWLVIRIAKGGKLSFEPAEAYMGKGTFEAARLLREKYGERVSIALCGPVGEYQGLLSGIAVTDREGRPSRMAGRGGVGAVMGSKKVKAIVVDLDKMPELADRAKLFEITKEYATKLGQQVAVKNYHDFGTAFVADVTNYMGGLPVRNFSVGQMVDRTVEALTIGGEHIREQQLAREGNPSHPCMPGCVVQCSNVYVDADGKELVSPLEYETLGLMGSNCGITDPDEIARLNWEANDLGIDSIEFGATMGILMDAGQGAFGDPGFIQGALDDLRRGTPRGRLLAQGTARVGEHFGIRRVPVIKKQALSAYDPRVLEVTGITMRTTAQGADHTAGNLPFLDCNGKDLDELATASFGVQINSMVSDTLGLCILGRSVHDVDRDLLARAVNACHGTQLEAPFFEALAREALRMERDFNKAAGFTTEDDDLPAFFRDEALPPTNKKARFTSAELNRKLEALLG
jgi:aldehyde:ferredoxin oxidoreductase